MKGSWRNIWFLLYTACLIVACSIFEISDWRYWTVAALIAASNIIGFIEGYTRADV